MCASLKTVNPPAGSKRARSGRPGPGRALKFRPVHNTEQFSRCGMIDWLFPVLVVGECMSVITQSTTQAQSYNRHYISFKSPLFPFISAVLGCPPHVVLIYYSSLFCTSGHRPHVSSLTGCPTGQLFAACTPTQPHTTGDCTAEYSSMRTALIRWWC